MNKVKNSQAGFTLIELVMVIVILGILAATALPKFVNLSADAYAAAGKGFGGALNSANSINYAACSAASTSCVHVSKCSDLGPLLNPPVASMPLLSTIVSPAVTTAGTLYLSADTAATTAGVTCTGAYGDGSTATGQSFTFTATKT